MMPIFGAINEGFSALHQRQFPYAIGVLERVLAEDPGNPTIMTYLSHACAGVGDTEGAILDLERLVEVAPDNLDARLRLAGLLRLHGLDHDALEHLEEAVGLDSRHLSARMALAYLLEDLGRKKGGGAAWEVLLSRTPTEDVRVRAEEALKRLAE